jgi:DNA invertase Pin-like site-specific DNA recombinase
MRIIAYLRVSTTEQAESGLGLEAQEHAVRGEISKRKWELVELVRDEGESGKSLARPGIRHALERIAAGEADGLVVAKLDRLSRSVVDFGLLLEWFTEAEATLVALDLGVDTSTPGGRLVANVFAAVAEWERDTIAARTKDGLAAKRAQGKPIGRAAVADNPELAARIRSMRDDAGMTLQAIADQLTAEGVPTARGAAVWRVSSVQAAAGYVRRKPRRRAAELPELRARKSRAAR